MTSQEVFNLLVTIWGVVFTLTLGGLGFYALKRYWDNKRR